MGWDGRDGGIGQDSYPLLSKSVATTRLSFSCSLSPDPGSVTQNCRLRLCRPAISYTSTPTRHCFNEPCPRYSQCNWWLLLKRQEKGCRMARLRICQTLCVCWFMGVTRRTLSCLLVDKVSIERPKGSICLVLGRRIRLTSPQGNVCTWPYMSPMELSHTPCSLHLTRPLPLPRCSPPPAHARAHIHTHHQRVAHKEDGSCTQAYPVHLLEGASLEQAPH
ncbi:hypothetical protein V8C34DRAFT_35452 [Trichoderma compactum]